MVGFVGNGFLFCWFNGGQSVAISASSAAAAGAGVLLLSSL